jgi:hypothetical protein
VPQLPTAACRKRFFRVITNDEHPEVAEIVRSAMAKLGWQEDRESMGADAATLERQPDASAVTLPTRKNAAHMWNMLWTWTSRVRVPEDELLMWQRVNHFQHCRCVDRSAHHLRHVHIARAECRARAFTSVSCTSHAATHDCAALQEPHTQRPAQAAPGTPRCKVLQLKPGALLQLHANHVLTAARVCRV